MQFKPFLHAIVLLILAAPTAQAHLITAQRGTLNFVNDGAYLMLSLPVSGFEGIDRDGDGKMSAQEFDQHRGLISDTIKQQVQLLDSQGALPLDGLLLSPSVPDNAPSEPSTQLVAVGKFKFAGKQSPLRFKTTLFGTTEQEQSVQLTVSDKAQGRKQLLVLSAEHNSRDLFPSLATVFVDYLKLGAEHIVTGYDHLLFLLVVLAAGWHWRQIVLMLSTFTVGHAITLALSAWGGYSLPSAIVEPAIAATIVLMAAYDLISAKRKQQPLPAIRLALVFGCALIHGLGLATALSDFGLDSQHQLTSLAGFNTGIELGQLVVALGAAVVVFAIRHLRPSFAH